MGNIKNEQVKKAGKTLMERFPNKFVNNFDENKRLVNSLTQGATTRVRNQIAGYITHKITLAQANSSTEPIIDEEESE